MGAGDRFNCVMVRRDTSGQVACGVEKIEPGDLPQGDVLIRVAASSLNYKDALTCQGHPGIVKSLPHIPGIDCAGQVVESNSAAFTGNEPVLVTGYGLGTEHWGGWSEYVRVPADWIVRLPPGLSAEEAMTYGTAGFTAAQCIERILSHGVNTEDGEIVVTGATGGVGSLTVALLSKLGYHVVAISGKPELADFLQHLGAKRVLPREAVDDRSPRPMLSSRWSAAVDTVGGAVLTTLLRSTAYRGCVTACGLVAGDELPTTVYPFLLRGITLYGIDSAKCPHEPRLEIWRKLSGEWKLDCLDFVRRRVGLGGLIAMVEEMLAGKSHGRVVVTPSL
jgi:putative YhdH/YhfP family quinone oxidoreductase